MRKLLVLGMIFFFSGGLFFFWKTRKIKIKPMGKGNSFLGKPRLKGEISLEETIAGRQSIRDFTDKALNLNQVSQILWAAKSVPSAGALYPLQFYLVVGKVENLDSGVYRYLQKNHDLEKIKDGDQRRSLMQACLGQSFIAQAPASLVIAADYERTTGRYGERGIRYVQIEVGHSGQNIYLQATALGLGTVAIGAFDDEEVSRVLNLPPNHKPLYVMPIGWPR